MQKNNREKLNECSRKSYYKYKERIKNYQQNNSQKIKEYHKEYYQKNQANLKKYALDFSRKNPEKRLNVMIQYLKKSGFSFKLDPYGYSWALNSWSKTIKKLGNGLCQVCNMKSEITHHLIYKSRYPELSLNVNNGIPLCRKCHNEVHGWNM